MSPLPLPTEAVPEHDRRHPRPHALEGPRFFSLSPRLVGFVGLVSALGIGAGLLGLVFGHSTDWIGLAAIVALVGVGQALALEVGRRLDLRQRGRLDRGRRALRPARRAPARDHDLGRRVERPALAVPLRPLQHRDARPLFARRRGRLHGPLRRRRGPVRLRRGRRRGGGGLLRGEHGPAQPRRRGRGSAAMEGGVPRAVRLARSRTTSSTAFIGGVICGRPRHGGPLVAGGLRAAAAADAQDTGGVSAPHEPERAEAPRGRRDDPDAERLARAGQPAAAGAFHRRDGEPLRHRRRTGLLHGRPFAPRPADSR